VAVEDIEREKDKTMGITGIGADAAKLAGLQIDTLQKVRSGQITLGQWERFNNLSFEERNRLCVVKNDFTLLADLGTITVPRNYAYMSSAFVPGDTFYVTVFRTITRRAVFSIKQCIKFLSTQRATNLGRCGTLLILDLKLPLKDFGLPTGSPIISFDRGNMYRNLNRYGKLSVPFLKLDPLGNVTCESGYSSNISESYTFFCFRAMKS